MPHSPHATDRYNGWTEAECDLIKRHYKTKPMKWLQEKLDVRPRSAGAIKYKAVAMGVTGKTRGVYAKPLTYQGVTLSRGEWAEKLGLTRAGFDKRIASGLTGKRLFAGNGNGKHRKGAKA